MTTPTDARAHLPVANPWGLTERQAETLDALCRTGCHKMVARELGIGLKTVETNMCRANQKLPGANRVLKLLAWDRWRRGGAA